jgi:phosphohistidine phosphatase
MTRLILMRHAKSSWNDPALSDHDRPLNARGRHAAQQMSMALVAQGYLPDVIICSTALRARKTLAPLLLLLDGCMHLTITRALYDAKSKDYPGIIEKAAETAGTPRTMLLIGHNFAIQDAALNLCVDDNTPARQNMLTKFPTGAAAILEFSKGLTDINAGSARLIDFLRPREL